MYNLKCLDNNSSLVDDAEIPCKNAQLGLDKFDNLESFDHVRSFFEVKFVRITSKAF